MGMPIDLETAKKLKEKGFMNEKQLAKVQDFHDKNQKVRKMADGGEVSPAEAPVDISMAPANEYDPNAAPTPVSYNGDPFGAAVQGMAQAPTLPQQPQATQTPLEGPQLAGAAPLININKFGDTTPEMPPSAVPKGQLVSDTLGGAAGERVPGAGMTNPYDAAFQMQQEGVANEMKAAQMRGAEQAAQYGAAAKHAQDIEDARRENADNMQGDLSKKLAMLDTQLDKYATTKIDPNRYWDNKTTGDKIMAGIGLVLGSFGAGGNRAVEAINRSINQDIEAQAANANIQRGALAGKQSIYNDMLGLYKNKDAAYAASQVAALNIAQLKLNEVASRYSSPEAQAKAQQLYGQLEISKQQANMQFQQTMMKMYAMQNPEAYKEFLDKDQRERIVPGFSGFAVSPDAAKDVREAQSSHLDAQNHIDALLRINEMPGRSINPDILAQARVHLNSLQGHMARGTFGRVSEQELQLVGDMIADPTKINSLKSVAKTSLDTLLDSSKHSVDAKAKAAGVVPADQAKGIVKTGEMPNPYGAKSSPASVRK